MTTYILLRSNKETGPFSLEQLREMGLKANDLVWVEGQSACWRNPGEINELKNLVVAPGNTIAEKKPELAQQPAESTPVHQHKHIFVALPPEPETLDPVKPSPAVLKDPGGFRPVEKPKEEIETKYAMSLDEIKERYVKTLESRRSGKKHFLPGIPASIRNIAVYAGVFILGAAIVMLLMRPGSSGPVAGEQVRLPVQTDEQPVEEIAVSHSDPESEVMLPESYYESESAGKSKEFIPADDPLQRTNGKKKPALTERSEQPVKTGDEGSDHKISIPKGEEPRIQSVTASEIAGQVSVKTNSYTIAALGGIRDLELTISNNSAFTLDKVTVEVNFLNPRGEIVKTEDVSFRSIQPNGTQTIGMKKSNRGVKVTHKIIRIESKEIGTHTASH